MNDKFKIAFEQLLAAVELNLDQINQAGNARSRIAFSSHVFEANNNLSKAATIAKKMVGL